MNLWEGIWCLEDMSFDAFAPIWSHVNVNEKQNEILHFLLATLVDTLPTSM